MNGEIIAIIAAINSKIKIIPNIISDKSHKALKRVLKTSLIFFKESI